MSKTTKILTTVVAIALVITAMVVGIYASTSGSAGITANVSWQAQAGITFTLDGSAVNGTGDKKVTKSMTQVVVTSSTTNTEAIHTNAGDLSIDFLDESTDNGVNDPSNIVFTYTLENTGTTKINVKLTKAPTAAAPVKVAGTATGAETGDYAALTGAAGVTLAAGATLEVTITLSMDAPAETNVTNFDAGVNFSMAKVA